MTILPRNFRHAVAVMAMASVALLSGCNKGLKDDVSDLKNRVSSLEALTKSLDEQLKAGSLLKSATAVGDGWTLEFSNGTIINVNNGGAPGNPGVTPQIEVRPITDGDGYSLWYNVTEGYPESGWIDTEVNIQGPAGNGGGSGSGGGPLDLRSYGGYIQYTTVENPSSSDWKNLFPIPSDGSDGADGLSDISAFFTLNDNKTVTILLSDGVSYTFEMYTEVPHGLVFVKAMKKTVDDAPQFLVTFRVNPSTVDAMAYDLEMWTIEDIGTTAPEATRASYEPTTSDVFDILEIKESQAGKTGEYVATLIPDAETFSNTSDYTLALVLKIDSVEDGDVLISSNAFDIYNALPEAPIVYVNEMVIGVEEDGEKVPVESPLTMQIDDVKNLIAIFDPIPDDTDVKWSFETVESLEEEADVVSLDETTGELKALNPGTVTVTVTSVFTPDGSEKTATLTVVVAPIYVETIVIKNGQDELVDGAVLNLGVGDDAVTLTTILTPDNPTNPTVEWSVSESGIVTVTDGVITIVGKGGPVTVTAKAVGADPQGTDVEASVIINVAAYVNGIEIGNAQNPTTPITDYTIDGIEETTTLVPIFTTGMQGVAPDDTAVKWEVVTNPEVATVDELTGLVTAHEVGEATITVTSIATKTGDPITSEAITVKVTSPVTGLSIDPGELFLVLNETNTKQLQAIILPEGATHAGVEWKSEDPDIATVDQDGNVTAVTTGETNVTVTVGGKTATCPVEVRITLSGLEVSDDDLNDILGRYNPKTSDEITAIGPNNVGQLWNQPGTSGNDMHSVGQTVAYPTNPDGVLTLEDELEAAFGGGVNFDVAYEILAQARWRQTTSDNNWYVNESSDHKASIDPGPPARIVTNGNTFEQGHNEHGDRLVIKVTVTEVPVNGVLSGIVLESNPFVTYICVRLP